MGTFVSVVTAIATIIGVIVPIAQSSSEANDKPAVVEQQPSGSSSSSSSDENTTSDADGQVIDQGGLIPPKAAE